MALPKKKEEFPMFTIPQGIAIVNQFNTYEDYLDSKITPVDLFYLEDTELAHQLMEMGYRSRAEIMSRVDFTNFKQMAEAARLEALANLPKKPYSAGKDVSAYPFLLALQEREKLVMDEKLSTVIFIRDYLKNGQEVSGYIDFAERMRTTDLEPVFLLKRRFLPTPHDLSYYNWSSNVFTTFETSSWEVIAVDETGMHLKNKIDRKTMNMDPTLSSPGENSTRTVIHSSEYEQIIIFDHSLRQKH